MENKYIEREAALQALCKAVHAKDGNIPCRNQLVSCLWAGTRTQEYAEKILAIPAADVVPVRHGKWKPHSKVETPVFHCSVCGGAALHAFGKQCKSDYCPNCGARMDGDA